ncbi:MAG: sulfite exporter TauE/SafE family protein [Burkholderiales bacterium]
MPALGYALTFVAGVAGSLHCIGMCGGFTCALRGASRDSAAWLPRQLLYNCGRVTTYAFLGALAGALGRSLHGRLDLAQRSLSVLAGLLMVVMALQLSGFLGRRHGTGGFATLNFTAALGGLVRTPHAAGPLALGVANGFLPCPLVYAFALQAAAAGGPVPGALIMAAFGLGTFPAMFLMAGLGGWIGAVWRRRGVRLAAVFILLLGIGTTVRGLLPAEALHGPSGAHSHPM